MKKLWLLVVPLLLGTAGIRVRNSGHSLGEGGIALNDRPTVLLEFAPASGVGMGSACACTVPTGSKGEVVTFTRSTVAYCTKGNEWSSIANGDLVECAVDKPLVMPGGDGTGPLGTLEEDASSNVLTQPEDLTHADWVSFVAGDGGTATKGSANTDVAPNGATTAEQVTFAPTGAADSSGLSQTVLTAAAYSGSLYAKGNATTGSGTFDVCIDTVASQTCMACSFVLASYTRCPLENITSKASGIFYIGNLSSLNGGTVRPQQTVTLWGAQAEAKAIVTSYMGTGRTRTSSSLSIVVNAPATPVVSIAASLVVGPTNFTGETFYTFATNPASSNNMYTSTWSGGAFNFNFRVGSTSFSVLPAGTPTVSATNRVAHYYNTTNVFGCLNGTCTAAAKTFVPFSGPTTLLHGRRTVGTDTFHANRVVKQVCFDVSQNGCR